MCSKAFDDIWEDIYSEGRQLNKYPWDLVVSFVYKNYPKERPKNEIKILELGCGSASNLWFAAREGFDVTGIDGSASAIKYARERFEKEGLKGTFVVGDFSQMSFDKNMFDLVIDRAAITCCSLAVTEKIIKEINRVLRAGGKFLFNPYSDRHSSFISGKTLSDGLTDEITDGSLQGVGKINFYSKREIINLFAKNWKIVSAEHMEIKDEMNPRSSVHAEWRAIAEKVD